MPTYDYECNACGFSFEAFHCMSDKPMVDCPNCGEPELVKLIGMGAAVIIRGTSTPCHGGRDKLGEGKNKGKMPFWRDGPINKKILKDSKKYIMTGEVNE